MYGYVYGYIYVKPYKNPYIKFYPVYEIIQEVKDYFKNNYKLDEIFYDYKTKPSNHAYKRFLEIYLDKLTCGDTLVALSLFQLGPTKVDIYRVLGRLRAEQVRLVVNKWIVDISSTMKKVVELSLDELAIYENKKFKENNCYDSRASSNYYRRLAGYVLDERYIREETEQNGYVISNIESLFD